MLINETLQTCFNVSQCGLCSENKSKIAFKYQCFVFLHVRFTQFHTILREIFLAKYESEENTLKQIFQIAVSRAAIDCFLKGNIGRPKTYIF